MMSEMKMTQTIEQSPDAFDVTARIECRRDLVG